jgi:N-acetylmuramoyl-L-alanine amidase
LYAGNISNWGFIDKAGDWIYFCNYEDNCTLYVTVYKNYLNKVIAGSTGNSEFVQLTGMKPLNVQLVDNSNLILLTVANTMNGIGYKYADNLGGSIIRSVQTTNIDNSTTQIAIYLNSTSKYFINEANNTYTISFGDSNGGNAYSDLQIKLPTGINFNQVKNEDRYYNNEFAIILPGDQRSFYAQAALSSNNNVVKNISVSYRNQNTEIIVQTTKIQGYKLAENNGFIDVTIGDPRDIYKNIVVLDAGHGGTDPGAVRSLNGRQINEKDINFKIMYTLTQKYFNSENSNIKVYYSRYNDTKVDLYERAAFADEVGADMFISLHMNANTDTSIKGTEIYYSNTNNSITDNGLNSKGLASLFLNYLPNAIGTRARSIRAQDYVVIRENTVPAILIELAFISNTDELSLMTDSTFQENTAKAIYDTLNIIFNAYPTGR